MDALTPPQITGATPAGPDDPRPYHSSYTEPHSTRGRWTSPPMHHPDRASALRRVDGVTLLAGRDAARRRTWIVEPCDCPDRRPVVER